MDFEKAFAEFIDTEEYDASAEVLFKISRAAFKAGWQASKKIEPGKIIELKQSDNNSRGCRK